MQPEHIRTSPPFRGFSSSSLEDCDPRDDAGLGRLTLPTSSPLARAHARSSLPRSCIALVQTSDVYNSSISADRSASGLARNLGFETVCVGRRSFVTPAGNGANIILMGICVSTRDLSDVGNTKSSGCGLVEVMVDGGDDTSFAKLEGVVLESGSNEKPLCGNCRFVEKVAFPGESPFMVIPLNVSSSPDDGECLLHEVCVCVGSIALRGDDSRDSPK